MTAEAEPSDPTELAGAADAETQSAYAWSADEDYPATGSWEDPERRWTPRRITILGVTAALAAVGGAAALGFSLLRSHEQVVKVFVATETATATTVVVTTPPPTVTVRPPASTIVKTVAPAVDYDQVFLASMRENGWAVFDTPVFLSRAHVTCNVLRQGKSIDDVAAGLIQVEPALTYAMARQFIAVTMATYPGCP